MKRHHLVILAIALAGASLAAQQSDRAKALDDQVGLIFGSQTFAAPRFGPARWLDGSSYTTVERSADNATGRDIIKYDESKDMVVFEAGEGNYATLFQVKIRGTPPEEVRAKKIYYWRRTNDFKTEGASDATRDLTNLERLSIPVGVHVRGRGRSKGLQRPCLH